MQIWNMIAMIYIPNGLDMMRKNKNNNVTAPAPFTRGAPTRSPISFGKIPLRLRVIPQDSKLSARTRAQWQLFLDWEVCKSCGPPAPPAPKGEPTLNVPSLALASKGEPKLKMPWLARRCLRVMGLCLDLMSKKLRLLSDTFKRALQFTDQILSRRKLTRIILELYLSVYHFGWFRIEYNDKKKL